MNTCHPNRPVYCKSKCKSCYNSDYKAANRARLNAITAQWHRDNKEQANAKKIAWALANPEKVKQTKKAYVSRNLKSYRAQCAKRHAAKMQRTPSWADLAAIKQIYLNCPESMEVDHIVPLQGKTVSGLHVPYNLQYLTPEQNRSKGNRI